MANVSSINGRTKHIGIRFHYTRELIGNKIVTLKYVPTISQVADAFTKPLPRILFESHVLSMGLEKLKSTEASSMGAC